MTGYCLAARRGEEGNVTGRIGVFADRSSLGQPRLRDLSGRCFKVAAVDRGELTEAPALPTADRGRNADPGRRSTATTGLQFDAIRAARRRVAKVVQRVDAEDPIEDRRTEGRRLCDRAHDAAEGAAEAPVSASAPTHRCRSGQNPGRPSRCASHSACHSRFRNRHITVAADEAIQNRLDPGVAVRFVSSVVHVGNVVVIHTSGIGLLLSSSI